MSIKNTLLASLCLALGACASDTAMKGSGTSGTGASYGSGAGTSSGASAMAGTGVSQSWVGTVQSIEPMTRQDAGIGVGSAGAAAAGGTLGATGSPTDRVYRVTLRMEDGSSQMVTLETQPTYATGDRVRYSNGMLQKEQ